MPHFVPEHTEGPKLKYVPQRGAKKPWLPKVRVRASAQPVLTATWPLECHRSNREHSSTGRELYWIQHCGWSSFESTNLIITARKSFWHSVVWHLALLNCPRSLGCQPCHFLFAERSVKIPADRNRADSFLFIKKKIGDNEFCSISSACSVSCRALWPMREET